MAGLPADMAQQIGQARVGGSGNYFVHGSYLLMIKKWFFLLSPMKERCIICEFIVIDSVGKTVLEGKVQRTDVPNAIGSDTSTVANFDGKGKQSAPANSRAVVLGLFGFTENQVPDDKVTATLDTCIDDVKQPCKGMLIGMTTAPIEIRSNPGNFIVGNNWECVASPNDPNGLNGPVAIAERLAALQVGIENVVNVTRKQLGKAPVSVTAQPEQAPHPAPAAHTAIPAAGFGFSPPAAAQPAFVPPAAAAPAPAFAPPAAAAAAPPAFTAPAPVPAGERFPGWTPHPDPNAKGYYYQGTTIKPEAELTAMFPGR